MWDLWWITNLYHKIWWQEERQTEPDNQDLGWWSLAPPASLPQSWYPGHPAKKGGNMGGNKSGNKTSWAALSMLFRISVSFCDFAFLHSWAKRNEKNLLTCTHISAQLLYLTELVEGMPEKKYQSQSAKAHSEIFTGGLHRNRMLDSSVRKISCEYQAHLDLWLLRADFIVFDLDRGQCQFHICDLTSGGQFESACMCTPYPACAR